jgi:hypothetical protein
MDTIRNRYKHYYYTSWYDSCYNAGNYVQGPWDELWNSTDIYAHYQYTNEPLEIIGVAVGVRSTEFVDTTRVPEYVLLVDGVADSMQYVFIDSARWDTATPKLMELNLRWYESVIVLDTIGDVVIGREELDTVEYNYYAKICEAYFKSPIIVTDSFFLGRTCYNNILPHDDVPLHPTSNHYTHQETVYEGDIGAHYCNRFSPTIASYNGTHWQRAYRVVGPDDHNNIHSRYPILFPIIRIKDTFSVQVMSNDEMYGTVHGGGAYLENSSVTITAVPAEGYKFIMWNDSVTTNPRTFTLNKDTVFTAYFAEIAQYTVEATSADLAQGTVQGSGSYYEGSTATITAVPNEGYTFTMWNDSVTANPRTIIVSQDTAFTAYFEVKVGIAEAEAAGELFSISPNPTTKNLQITISQEGSYTMEIYSANGVMLKQESIANMSTIDVFDLLAGSYVIKIYNDTASGIRTFVKQ